MFCTALYRQGTAAYAFCSFLLAKATPAHEFKQVSMCKYSLIRTWEQKLRIRLPLTISVPVIAIDSTGVILEICSGQPRTWLVFSVTFPLSRDPCFDRLFLSNLPLSHDQHLDTPFRPLSHILQMHVLIDSFVYHSLVISLDAFLIAFSKSYTLSTFSHFC
jgi:hypothetical protein